MAKLYNISSSDERAEISLWRTVYSSGYLDNRERRKMLLSLRMRISEFLFPSLSLASLLSDHTSPARSHRPLRITLTNSTPRQTDKCLHVAGAAPAPVCCWNIKGGIQMTNSCHLLWCYVTWWRPCHEWQTSQWCGSWDSVNWIWEIKSRISQWMQVSKFSRIMMFLNTECVMA